MRACTFPSSVRKLLKDPGSQVTNQEGNTRTFSHHPVTIALINLSICFLSLTPCECAPIPIRITPPPPRGSFLHRSLQALMQGLPQLDNRLSEEFSKIPSPLSRAATINGTRDGHVPTLSGRCCFSAPD